MDEIDLANDRRDAELENRISDHMYRMNQSTVHYVDCAWCGTETENGAKYCCAECLQDADRFENARARNVK